MDTQTCAAPDEKAPPQEEALAPQLSKENPSPSGPPEISATVARLTSNSIDELRKLVSELQKMQEFLKSEVDNVQHQIDCAVAGGPAQRISFDQTTDGTYSTPVWSPRGDYIAFTKQGGGQFSIGIMKPDGSGERLLTSGFHNEGPTFAPNGRVLMFFRDPGGNGGPSLFTVDISGRFEQREPTPGFASDPAWSPLLS